MRIILSEEDLKGEKIIISGDKARYLISVLRCKAGDELQILDAAGSLYKSKITEIENRRVIADILEKISCDTESPLNLTLVQGILKGEKMDWIIQKATELGVKEIIPAITERSQIRQTRKTERWRKIAEEASRQSGRSIVPIVHEPADFSSWLIAHSSSPLKGFIFYEEGGVKLSEALKKGIKDWGLGVSSFTNPQTQTPNPFFIIVGPEGGFTKKEVELANSRGFISVSLGKRILRAETAAISAMTLVQFLMGDINQS